MMFEPIAAEAEPFSLHLVEEINHRVANTYTEAILSLSRTATEPMTPGARQALEKVVNRLYAQAASHRALMPPATTGLVDLADYLGDLCACLSQASLAERGVHLAVQTDSIFLARDRAWRLGLILAELVRNAARHGLAGREGSISVGITERLGDVHCLVCDDGRTMPNAKPGRGSHIVRRLIAELGGAVEWRFTPDGCRVRLRAPTH